MIQITLTAKQMLQLSQLKEAFPCVEYFNITETHESGIGPTTRVEFTIFPDELSDEPDTVVDITDVSVW
jgi:hypothetical protein